jgi:hypothetical protein
LREAVTFAEKGVALDGNNPGSAPQPSTGAPCPELRSGDRLATTGGAISPGNVNIQPAARDLRVMQHDEAMAI